MCHNKSKNTAADKKRQYLEREILIWAVPVTVKK